MEQQELIDIIKKEMAVDLPEKISMEELRQQLSAEINDLIVHDFQKLVGILYRIDINERKLKYLLQENVGEDAAVIIADLIIERQLQKIKSRQEYRRDNTNINEEEKW
jgi:hypothetical protein